MLLQECPREPWRECVDEVLIFMSLLPLLFCNLRAQIRKTISCSDASNQGGGAAEASRFLSKLSAQGRARANDVVARLVEDNVVAQVDLCCECHAQLDKQTVSNLQCPSSAQLCCVASIV